MPDSNEIDTGRILVVENDPDLAASIEMILGDSGEGHEVEICDDGSVAFEKASDPEQFFDLVLTGFRLSGMGGLELLSRLRESSPMRPVVLMAASSGADLAIEAIKLGAYDFLLKPFDSDILLDVARRAIRASRSMQSPVSLGKPDREKSNGRGEQPALNGSCPAMQTVYKDIGRLAPTDVTVLVMGETGSGKELVATALYQHSSRSDRPFVAVNCGAIPENLLESELFGHVRGAFTGATTDRIGRFQQADSGTLFLDEIGDIPLPVQVKLLRVLQEGIVQPLGSDREVEVDVRIVAATHQPLPDLITRGEFREDLYYRINSAQITLPPLRERGDDIKQLIRIFAKDSGSRFGVPAPAFPANILKRLKSHPWPGNVRELKNVISRIVLRGRGFDPTIELVESVLEQQSASAPDGDEIAGSDNGFASIISPSLRRAIEQAREDGKSDLHAQLVTELERQMISTALELSGGHLGKVCDWLGISRVTLRKKMSAFEMDTRKASA
ncbi:MAG: sigma-54-dependent Fis family transcriptional regulator [Verrucomicrobiales bacterium]|nr:sigma-54-dependent Fis family transcriptional regulator [Verrucomicrobiales bacterium]